MALPIVSMFTFDLSTRAQDQKIMSSVILEQSFNLYFMDPWSETITDRKTRKITVVFSEIRFEESAPVSMEHSWYWIHRHSSVANYLKIDISHAEHGQLSIKWWILLSSLMGACTYLITRRKYVRTITLTGYYFIVFSTILALNVQNVALYFTQARKSGGAWLKPWL